MPLSIGIVGLPNVGKSTLFQTLTKKQVDIANYPFCTIDPNVGVVAVPDERVDKLAALTNSARKIYTTIEFVDIAGLVKGANKGEGLGNKFLANIRETDAILYVLRAFAKNDIINTEASVDPIKEKEILDTELALKDLETIEKRLREVEGEAKSNVKGAREEQETLLKAKQFLVTGQILYGQIWTEDELKYLNGYQLLTIKPRLYLLMVGMRKSPIAYWKNLKLIAGLNLIIDVLTEFEASEFSREDRASLGLPLDSELDVLIQESYKLLDLITFLPLAQTKLARGH